MCIGRRIKPIATSRRFKSESTFEDMQAHQTHALTEDERRFVTAVQDSIRNAVPRLADDPALLDKLKQAYGEARVIGLAQEKLLADFLYLEMQSPGFHRHPAIRGWLHQPGATPDERFADLIDLLRNKFQQLKEIK